MMSAPTERNPLLRRRAAAAAAPTNSSASAQGASRGAAHDVGSVVGRTVLITGANTGIGFQSARALAQQGAHVVMACRNEQRGTEAARRIAALVADDIGGEPGSADHTRVKEDILSRLTVRRLDLASLRSVREFADAWFAPSATSSASGSTSASPAAVSTAEDVPNPPVRPLAGLIMNAGLNGFGGMDDKMTEDALQLVYGVNFVAHAALSLLMMPALLAGRPSRLVALSSVTHRTGDGRFAEATVAPGYINYSNSKLALTMWTRVLQRRLNENGVTGVTCVNANPGGVASDIWRRSPALARRALNCVLLTPQQGAATSVAAMTRPDLRGGEYLTPYYIPKWAQSLRWRDTRVAQYIQLAFDSLGPFCGARVARSSTLSYDRNAQERLWQSTVSTLQRVGTTTRYTCSRSVEGDNAARPWEQCAAGTCVTCDVLRTAS